MGNGLRQDIYREFQQRFAIPWIGELYASTEGPFGMVNCLNVPGSCGRHSPFLVCIAVDITSNTSYLTYFLLYKHRNYAGKVNMCVNFSKKEMTIIPTTI